MVVNYTLHLHTTKQSPHPSTYAHTRTQPSIKLLQPSDQHSIILHHPPNHRLSVCKKKNQNTHSSEFVLRPEQQSPAPAERHQPVGQSARHQQRPAGHSAGAAAADQRSAAHVHVGRCSRRGRRGDERRPDGRRGRRRR